MPLLKIFSYFQFSVILHFSQAYTVNSGYSSYQGEVISGACTVQHGSTPEYEYNVYSDRGPPQWSRLSRCCGGRRQSPVNLIPRRALCDQPYSLRYSKSRTTSLTGDIHNNGHTAKVKFDKWQSARLLNVPKRPGLSYRLTEVHYHAGYVQGMGSEHLVDGQGFDGEIHLVHYNTKYSNVEEAMTKDDGLVIVSVFIQGKNRTLARVADSNIILEIYLKQGQRKTVLKEFCGCKYADVAEVRFSSDFFVKSKHIQESNTSTNGELGKLAQKVSCLNGKGKDEKIQIKLRPLQFIPRKRNFYIYEGSLTAPPCSESVLWIIMTEPVKLPTSKVNLLRHLQYKDGSLLSTFSNIRPIQDLNYRLVETNMPCSNTINSFRRSYN